MVVNRQVSLVFTLGKYSDEILYDVVPMEATHILLVTHDGVTNRFSFEYMGLKMTLKPLSPKEVCEDQLKMKKMKRNDKSYFIHLIRA
ncbi:hypothetical protein CR513_33209, partial [Mucuna pruriens]